MSESEGNTSNNLNDWLTKKYSLLLPKYLYYIKKENSTAIDLSSNRAKKFWKTINTKLGRVKELNSINFEINKKLVISPLKVAQVNSIIFCFYS